MNFISIVFVNAGIGIAEEIDMKMEINIIVRNKMIRRQQYTIASVLKMTYFSYWFMMRYINKEQVAYSLSSIL